MEGRSTSILMYISGWCGVFGRNNHDRTLTRLVTSYQRATFAYCPAGPGIMPFMKETSFRNHRSRSLSFLKWSRNLKSTNLSKDSCLVPHDEPGQRAAVLSLEQAPEDTACTKTAVIGNTLIGDRTRDRVSERSKAESTPSHRRNVFVSNCLGALDILGPLLNAVPVPGLAAAPLLLSAAIKRIQYIPAAEEGWKRLAKRLDQLADLTKQVQGAEDIQEMMVRCLTFVNEELVQLATDLENAGKERRLLEKFFSSKIEYNSIATHERVLDNLISNFTAKLCLYTALRVRETQQQLQKINKGLESNYLKSVDQTGLIGMRVGDTSFAEIEGGMTTNFKLASQSALLPRALEDVHLPPSHSPIPGVWAV